jgi:hypothetical protein
MERRLEQRFEHLPHGLHHHPIGHVGNPQPALPAARLSPDPPRREAGSVRIGTKNDLLSRGKAAE